MVGSLQTQKMNTIRPAKIGELNKLVTILLSAIQRMAEKDIFQWDEYYPNKSVLQNDIEKRKLIFIFMLIINIIRN